MMEALAYLLEFLAGLGSTLDLALDVPPFQNGHSGLLNFIEVGLFVQFFVNLTKVL